MPLIKRLKLWLNTPISLSTYVLLLSIWFIVPLGHVFLMHIALLTPYSGMTKGLFLLAAVCILFCYHIFTLNVLTWRIFAKPLSLTLVILGGFSYYFMTSFGIAIDAHQIQNVMQTDPSEVMDLITLRSAGWFIFLIVLPCIIFSSIKIKKQPLKTTLTDKVSIGTISFITMATLVFIYNADLSSTFRNHRDLKDFIAPQNVIHASWSYYEKLSPPKNIPFEHYADDAHISQSYKKMKLPKLFVLVIGETARAESFSLNGYPRPTNPELSSLPVIYFSQASSCGTATAISIPCMFSGMARADYDAKLAPHRENLLDILEKENYKVIWFDNNSGCKDVCNRVERYQFSEALKQKWCKDGECLDEILVDALDDHLKHIVKNDSRSTVIVLHQMGSHGPAYYKRSSPEYQPFKPFCATNEIQSCSRQELLNVYDNSIVYTDHVLSAIIKRLSQNHHYQTALWYLSDHGESTGEEGLYLHGAPYFIAPAQQTHIPMLMWFSPEWQKNAPKQTSCLNTLKQQKTGHDNLYPTLLSLFDVDTQTKDKHLDLLAQCEK